MESDEEEDGWLPTVDHSQDFEIRQTKDGRVFGVKNLQVVPEEGIVKADMAGDVKACQEFLHDYAFCLQRLVPSLIIDDNDKHLK